MASKSIEALIEDIRFLSADMHDIVQAVRALVASLVPTATVEVKYGGILFSSGVPFCGVFAYREHASVEFGSGARISDPYGFLEGAGKGRRHIKLRSVADIDTRKLADYLPLALAAACAD